LAQCWQALLPAASRADARRVAPRLIEQAALSRGCGMPQVSHSGSNSSNVASRGFDAAALDGNIDLMKATRA
jgi:hypothetical protein